MAHNPIDVNKLFTDPIIFDSWMLELRDRAEVARKTDIRYRPIVAKALFTDFMDTARADVSLDHARLGSLYRAAFDLEKEVLNGN